MKCLIASLCVMALAALPARASANTGSEAASAKRIVIAYIPEHLQLRVPGPQHQYQSSPTLPRGTEVEQVADTSGGLEWDMWAPEPTTTQQPKFEVEYVPPTPAQAAREKRVRKRKIAIGVTVPVVIIGAIAGGILIANAEPMRWDWE
jgi:hypothetical protein